ncbi:hypothetical protein KP003_14270 [Geomonas nitrogeniifigens]|uniref:Swt1 family HEPN domain-containing protein n=1 Tax=Geomonas diazotrophica TaxID=2843197 RepID=UPI001C2C4D24|nr:Swt1 family HEPN domain-containing protein [Geomonas nitrogeniifigens]QXE85542.1 hypothetical protein KP003_14270 [Geomonas nitrogeniifigens]
MYNLLFKETTGSLRVFLHGVLSEISDIWWTKCVLNVLSPDQKRQVEESRVKDLSGLDLQPLIIIFDRNWKEISKRRSLPPTVRTYLKEIQAIRNQWAHPTGEVDPEEDICRSLDTLERLLKHIEADSALIARVAERRKLEEGLRSKARQQEEGSRQEEAKQRDGFKNDKEFRENSSFGNNNEFTGKDGAILGIPLNVFNVFKKYAIIFKQHYEDELAKTAAKTGSMDKFSINSINNFVEAGVKRAVLEKIYDKLNDLVDNYNFDIGKIDTLAELIVSSIADDGKQQEDQSSKSQQQ